MKLGGRNHGPERIPASVFQTADAASAAVAAEIAALIHLREAEGKAVRAGPGHRFHADRRLRRIGPAASQRALSFRNVITFNLDEYWPMRPDELQSYAGSCASICSITSTSIPANVHIPDGTLPLEELRRVLRGYERKIDEAGGIDLQMLGIGRTGHIGFNEPGSPRDSRTRLITLDRVTRLDAASDFFGDRIVPRRAITMGVGTILSAGAWC